MSNIINIRDTLNKIDLRTDNKYDLRNLYESVRLSDTEKKQLAKLLSEGYEPKYIYNTLNSKLTVPSCSLNESFDGEEVWTEDSNFKKPLYVIKNSKGEQLSAPNPDDEELWDRVAAMEMRGQRGLKVVAYTEGLDEDATTTNQNDPNQKTISVVDKNGKEISSTIVNKNDQNAINKAVQDSTKTAEQKKGSVVIKESENGLYPGDGKWEKLTEEEKASYKYDEESGKYFKESLLVESNNNSSLIKSLAGNYIAGEPKPAYHMNGYIEVDLEASDDAIKQVDRNVQKAGFKRVDYVNPDKNGGEGWYTYTKNDETPIVACVLFGPGYVTLKVGYDKNEDSDLFEESLSEAAYNKLNEASYRGVPNTTFIGRGNYSDPLISTKYNGKTYKANYWDIEESMWEYYNEEKQYSETHNDGYADNLKSTYTFDGSDEDFEKFLFNHAGEIQSDIVEMSGSYNESLVKHPDPVNGAYSKENIERDLRDLTNNFTREDTLKCGFEEEDKYAQEILGKHYNKVSSKKQGEWFVITFSEPKSSKNESINEGLNGDTYKGYSILLDDDSINWDAEQVRLVWTILDKDGNKVGSVAGQANAREFIDNLLNQYIGKKVEIDLQDTAGLDEESYQLFRDYNDKALEIVGFHDGDGSFEESSWDISDGVNTLEGVPGTYLSLVESISEPKSSKVNESLIDDIEDWDDTEDYDFEAEYNQALEEVADYLDNYGEDEAAEYLYMNNHIYYEYKDKIAKELGIESYYREWTTPKSKLTEASDNGDVYVYTGGEAPKDVVNVVVEDGVEKIDNQAFRDCKSLTSITIPNSVTSIGGMAFDDCTNLTNVVIGNSVKHIHNYAFSDCENLNNVVIPKSVEKIDAYAFEDCHKLEDVKILNSNARISEDAFNGTPFGKTLNKNIDSKKEDDYGDDYGDSESGDDYELTEYIDDNSNNTNLALQVIEYGIERYGIEDFEDNIRDNSQFVCYYGAVKVVVELSTDNPKKLEANPSKYIDYMWADNEGTYSENCSAYEDFISIFDLNESLTEASNGSDNYYELTEYIEDNSYNHDLALQIINYCIDTYGIEEFEVGISHSSYFIWYCGAVKIVIALTTYDPKEFEANPSEYVDCMWADGNVSYSEDCRAYKKFIRIFDLNESLNESSNEASIDDMKDYILNAYGQNRTLEKLIDKMIFQEYDIEDRDNPLDSVPDDVIKDTYDRIKYHEQTNESLTEASNENMRDINALILMGGGTDECVKLINDVRAEYPGIDDDELADMLENMNDDLNYLEWLTVISYFDEYGKFGESLTEDDSSENRTVGLYGDEVPGMNSVDEIVSYFEKKGLTVSDVSGDMEYGWEMDVTGKPKSLFTAIVGTIPGYNSKDVKDFIDEYAVDDLQESSYEMIEESTSLKEYTYDDSHMKVEVVYENEGYKVEYHPNSGRPYWIIDKRIINPLHPEETFYDEERAIEWADIYNDRYGETLSEGIDDDDSIDVESLPVISGCHIYNSMTDVSIFAVSEDSNLLKSESKNIIKVITTSSDEEFEDSIKELESKGIMFGIDEWPTGFWHEVNREGNDWTIVIDNKVYKINVISRYSSRF